MPRILAIILDLVAASTTSVKVLRHPFAVVDLFAGPGGLGEGFSARRGRGKRVYRCRLSVEMDRAAHRTLTLRTFLREFDEGPPDSYYDWLSGVTDEPDWRRFYPDEWRAARKAVVRLELGSGGASARLRPLVERIRRESRGRTVLLGGPPCQAYSVIGRARNAAVPVVVREQDVRLTLYREFARVLGWLRPPAFVMENVKGMLSARSGGRPIFPVIEKALRRPEAAASLRYTLFALTGPKSGAAHDPGNGPHGHTLDEHAQDWGPLRRRQPVHEWSMADV